MLARNVGLLLMAACFVAADINMHNPRGSNNRQDENWRERRNAQRLFNSQNNNRGGHNVGPSPGAMHYYSGSQLQIQWANQHSCGDENNKCQVVLQYMCDENLRDGKTTNTAPVTCRNDCDTNEKYGRHEPLIFYEDCNVRERNLGLFTADRRLRGDTAIYTRQNNNGRRYGYECPEERDYYPYFGHSPWKDIAIMTNDDTVCDIVTQNSQNVKSRWVCTFSEEDWGALRGKGLANRRGDPILYLDKESCEQSSIRVGGTTYTPIWTEIPSHGIPAPECISEQFSRDNHQGNTIGGEFLHYNWTIPNIDASSCALRIRYNISTNDFPFWTTNQSSNLNIRNRKFGPEEIYESYGFEGDNGVLWREVARRQYYLRNDPNVDVFDISQNNKHFRLKLALNTAQFGRTFQDRSHSFSIVNRPTEIPLSAEIYNLNVRGKRGNLAQVYPSVEYDFVPTSLHTSTDDYVHIQWTGSNNNPFRAAGEGRRRTDRSNIVQLRRRPYIEGTLGSNLTLGTNYPPEEICHHDLFGVTNRERRILALAGDFKVGDTPGTTLDDGTPYFNFGLLKTSTVGEHYFFSTRNNNFSNRDQKAKIVVD